jgi:hypothetical protein
MVAAAILSLDIGDVDRQIYDSQKARVFFSQFNATRRRNTGFCWSHSTPQDKWALSGSPLSRFRHTNRARERAGGPGT